MKLKVFFLTMLVVGFLSAQDNPVLISMKDLLNPKVWTGTEGAKVEVKEKAVCISIPAGKKEAVASIDVRKIKKDPWWEYNALKMEIENNSKSKVTFQFRLVRRALDDCLIQAENPRYDIDVTLKPGKNSIEIDVTDASNNSSREIMVENIKFIFSNTEKTEQVFIISKFSLEQVD